MADTANQRQVGGNHYKVGDLPEHWDLAIMYQWDPFQYQITKYVMRWKDKAGIQDLEKAAHFLEKYIEAAKAGKFAGPKKPWWNPPGTEDRTYSSAHMMVRDAGFEMAPVKQTGYTNFTFEGGSAIMDLYTCRLCRQEVKTVPNTAPTWHVCAGADITGGNAG
jgi:hypothetical protein